MKLLGSLDSHCTKWANDQHRPAGFESRFVPDLPIPLIPTLIGLRVIDLVSNPVWWEAEANAISLAGRQPRVWEKSNSPLVTLRPKPNQQQLPMRHCSRFPLKMTSWFQPADNAGIWPVADNARTLPASQFKSPFHNYPETPSVLAQCSRHNYQPLNLTALFGSNSESLT